MQAKDVLDFWSQLGNEGWWRKNPEVDAEIHEKFGTLHDDACSGKLDSWADTPDGALALIIILDQFSRNMFRGDAKSFSQDPQALEIAEVAIKKGFDQEARKELLVFFYLPFEHSEKIADQERSVLLQHSISNPEAISAALEHREIVKRFGRFPHRNEVLGRHTTPAEIIYLAGDGFKG